MNILLAHNYYQSPGGEDQVFHAETSLLRLHGHRVRTFTLHNDAITTMSRGRLAVATIWNQGAARELGRLLRQERPDIVHFHNTFPLMSPSAYSAVRRYGVPVVQTLHNYRLFCLNGLFLRDEAVCEKCLGRPVAWPGVTYGCYRGSRTASAVTATMLGLHRLAGTWSSAVDVYVALSEFARDKFIAGGLPRDRIRVKPHFLNEDPGLGRHAGDYALYAGRLSREKGVHHLVRLWPGLAHRMKLRVIGSGPLEHLRSEPLAGVEWLGWQPREAVLAAMRDARFLLFPSEWYEGLPMVLLEAMATGLPILASNQGPLREIIQDGETGILVQAGEPRSWLATVQWALDHPEALAAMGRRAREQFENRYTAQRGYEGLMNLYYAALGYPDPPPERSVTSREQLTSSAVSTKASPGRVP